MWRRVTTPDLSILSVDPVVGLAAAVGARGCFGAGLVGRGGGGAVFEGAVGTQGVVLAAEPVQEGLQLGDGGGLVGLGAEPVLHGLLEAFDLPAGGGVVRAGVLLHDVESA